MSQGCLFVCRAITWNRRVLRPRLALKYSTEVHSIIRPCMMMYGIAIFNRTEVIMESLNKDKMLADLKVVLADAESFLKTAAATTGEKATELREKAAASLKSASEKIVDLQSAALEKGKAAAHATDDFVHERPWTSVGIAAAAGFLLGLLVNRK